jgi:hypothetical protein
LRRRCAALGFEGQRFVSEEVRGGISRLLDFVLSNCAWKDGPPRAGYRQPFVLLAKNVIALESKIPAEQARTGIFDNCLAFVDAYRTLERTGAAELIENRSDFGFGAGLMCASLAAVPERLRC